MLKRWPLWLVAALLLAVQAQLWLGKGNLPYTMGLSQQLQAQQAVNTGLRERNREVAAEVTDLRDGLEMLEERARSELGMLKPDEILVQVTPAVAPAAAAARAAPAAPPASAAR